MICDQLFFEGTSQEHGSIWTPIVPYEKFSPSSKGIGHAGNMSIETGGTACEIDREDR